MKKPMMVPGKERDMTPKRSSSKRSSSSSNRPTSKRSSSLDQEESYNTINLVDALLMLEKKGEVTNFLRDLCTPQEISAMNERWRVCQLLESGTLSYRDIHQQTGASLTTISRVARFLKDEPNHGYRCILDRIRKRQ